MTHKKKLLTSLHAKLLVTVLVSVALAFLAGFGAEALGEAIIGKTYMSPARVEARLEADAAELQSYVKENNLSVRDNEEVAKWTISKQDVYVLLYQDQRLAMRSYWEGIDTDSGAAENLADVEDAVPYPIQFRDGILQAVFYDYSSGRLYSLVYVLSVALACVVVALGLLRYNRRITRAIIFISREVQSIGQGNLNLQLVTRTHDELGDLTTAVEQMRRSLLLKTQEEQRALQQNSDLISAMSHDIRNPLTALLGYLELSKNGQYATPEELQAYLSASYDKAVQLKGLSDELLRYSLLFGAAQLPMHPENYDASILLPQLLVEGCTVLQQQGFNFAIGQVPDGEKIRVDVTYFQRVLDNLFDNIRKYADAAYPVQITTKVEENRLVLQFENRIAPAGKKVESNRIGLRTCVKILEQMGGTFEKSTAGQTFTATVTLPTVGQ